ncbi:MAG: Crp/Fnr family transcriptional regulator [Rubrivivax sp.]|nr:Crp/Fnr family transcriptional regulator [Rubrivivax sp.]
MGTPVLQLEPSGTPLASPPTRGGHASPSETLGHLADLVRTLGGGAEALGGDEARLPIALWHVRQGAVLFHEGSRVQDLHVMRSGTMRCVKTAEDGYEQVLSFAGLGEVLGFDALCRGTQPVSAQALEECTVYVLPLQDLRGLRLHSPAFDQALLLALSRQLARAAELTEMMAAVAADVRLARFLLWMSSRMAELGRSPRRLHLAMCRRDIASCLGVAHETVSRSFSALADGGCIKVNNREVELLDLARLQARARSTRNVGDDLPADHGHAEAPHGRRAGPVWWAGIELAGTAAGWAHRRASAGLREPT